ncbi:MAG: MlaD family protein [Planctomycetota bacterium]
MTAPVDRWKLGLFVIAGIAVLLGGLTFAGMAQLKRPCHAAYAFFDEPLVGLEPGSSVRFRGVPIGVVDDITLAPDKKHLQVLASLYDDKLVKLGLDPEQLGPDREFPVDLRAQLVTQYLTQTSFVLVDFHEGGADPQKRLPFDVPINTIPTIRSTFRSLEEGLRDFLRELPEVTGAARQLLDALRTDLKAADLPALSRRADAALRTAEQKVKDLDQMPVLQSATASFRELEGLVRDWKKDDGPVNGTLAELRMLGVELRRAIEQADVAATTQSLRAGGEGARDAGVELAALSRDLRQDLVHVRAALASIERLTSLLERDPGALLHGRAPSTTPLRKD